MRFLLLTASLVGAALLAASPTAAGTDLPPLVERPGRSDAGGVTLHLEGRFLSAVVARVGANGAVETRCEEARALPPAPASAPGPAAAAVVRGPSAATFEVVNGDAPGEGLNDPTPRSPVGGNPGTTLGQQRLEAFRYAASLWAARIDSSVPVRILASFDALSCGETAAVLGVAGSIQVHRDFSGAPRAGTWYPSSLAAKLARTDLDAGVDDIQARFNGALDGGCAFPRRWYYGFDASPSAEEFDFVTIVNHEVAHGLGFATYVDLPTGAKLQGRDDAYLLRLLDAATGRRWNELTDAQRKASAVATGQLLWDGPAVTAKSGLFSGGIGAGGRVRMYAPAALEAGSSVLHWDTTLFPHETLEPTYTEVTHQLLITRDLLTDVGWGATVPESPYAWILPSSARADGRGGAFFTTDLLVANRGSRTASLVLKFLGHDADGTNGAERAFSLGAGRAVTYRDVLATVFGLAEGYGAIKVSSSVAELSVLGLTATAAPPAVGGTYGQSVAAFSSAEAIGTGALRVIHGLREDALFRTNLVLVNATAQPVVVDLLLRSEEGAVVGSPRGVVLPPLAMTQVGSVVAELGGAGAAGPVQVLLSTPTPGGAFVAYAALIDNATNDPRTLLPR